MADEKKSGGKSGGKPGAKPAPSSAGKEMEYVFFALIACVVVFVIIPSVVKFFGYGDVKYDVPSDLSTQASHFFSTTVEVVSAFSIFLMLLLVMGIIYAKFRYKEVTEAFNAVQGGAGARGTPTPADPASFHAAGPDPRWLEIERHMASGSQSDWRVAILEADILLYDMLDQMGYPGDTVAEKLKAVDPVNFTTLQDAWNAHKIRNIIAHEGANYDLTREEADRATRLFKKVFEEFYFI